MIPSSGKPALARIKSDSILKKKMIQTDEKKDQNKFLLDEVRIRKRL